MLRTIAMLLTGLLCLTGCGWHLQGHTDIVPRVSPLYLDLTDPHSDFANALKSRLRAADVQLSDSRQQARAVLTVSKERTGHDVPVVSALNEPQQYDVYYEVTMSISSGGMMAGDSVTLVPLQSTRLSRLMNYDKTAALAMQRQERLLQLRLAEDLAEQVLRRLSFVTTESR